MIFSPIKIMITINERYQFSKELLLHSTIIQDMMADCKGEIPKDIELPNVAKEISLEVIQELEKIKNWLPPDYDDLRDTGRTVKKETLDTAILFDMRDLIPLIIFTVDGYEIFEHLQVPNVLKACIENSNGHAYDMLQIILVCCTSKTIRTALYHLEEFSRYDKTGKILFLSSGEHGIKFCIDEAISLVPIRIKYRDLLKTIVWITQRWQIIV